MHLRGYNIPWIVC